LTTFFPILKNLPAFGGLLWSSWPKSVKGRKPSHGGLPAPGASKAQVREIGLSAGLVDVKVYVVDETWSGLKFVYRVANRA
jgi:hypothetical protein